MPTLPPFKSAVSTALPSRQVFLSNLKRIRIAKVPEGHDGNATCSICFGDLADKAVSGVSERAVRLHGTHIFGEQCIRRWLEENDSCPICRTKVHAGIENCHGRIVNVLIDQTRFLMRQRPTPDQPILDLLIFKHLENLGRGLLTVTSDLLTAQLEASMTALLVWRTQWWERNPSCLSLPDFEPYTRMDALRVEDLDVQIVVHEPQFSALLVPVVDAGLVYGFSNTSRGLSLHVGAHPIANIMETAMRRQVHEHAGERMTVSTLAIGLRDALESGPRTRGVMTGEREDLPRGIQFFWEDVMVRVLRGVIVQQRVFRSE